MIYIPVTLVVQYRSKHWIQQIISKAALGAISFHTGYNHQDRKDAQQSIPANKGTRRGYVCSWRSKTGLHPLDAARSYGRLE